MEAARLWACGLIYDPKEDAPHAEKPEDAEALAALRAFGMFAEGPLSHRRDGPPGEFYLWPEHLQAFQIFRDCLTKWRWSDGGRTGLHSDEVQHVMRRHSGRRSGFRPKVQARLWREIEVLELGALRAWADERAKRTGSR